GIYLDQYTAGGAVQNVLIDSNTFTNNSAAGVGFSSTSGADATSNITISNNVFDGDGNGIYMYETVNSTVRGNTIKNSTGSGLGLYGDDSNDTIDTNTITNNNTGNSSGSAGIRIGSYNDATPNSNIAINYNNIDNQANGAFNLSLDPYPSAPLGTTADAYSGTLDATNNFWGVTTSAAVAATISDPLSQVNYTPFLGYVAYHLVVVAGQAELVDGNGNVVATNPTSFDNSAGPPITLVIDYSNGDPAPGGFTFTGSGGDSLIVTGYNTPALTDTYTGAHSGTVQLAGDGLITYSGLLPLTNSGTATDIIFDLPNGTVGATLQDDGTPGNNTSELISPTASFETTTFTDPTGSLTVNAGTGTQTINAAASLTTDFNANLNLNGAAGSGNNDTINVQTTPAAGTTTIDGKGGSNTVTIGSTAPTLGGTLANIAGPVTVLDANGTTADALTIDDSGDTSPQAGVTVSASQISGFTGGVAAINYAGLQFGSTSVTLDGGSGNNTISVPMTAPNLTTTINAGAGNDIVNVQTTANTSVLVVDGQGGSNVVNFGSNAPTLGGTMVDIAGQTTVKDTGGTTALTLDDSGGPTAEGLTISATQVNGYQGAFPFNYSGLSSLTLYGDSYGNTFTVSGTAAGATTTINSGTGSDTVNVQATAATGPLTIHGQGGSDTVNAGDTGTVGANPGNVQGILGNVTVDNAGGSTAMTIDDTTDTVAQNLTVTASSVTGFVNSVPAALGTYTYANLSSLSVDGGTAGNIFNVTTTPASATTTLDGGNAGDTFNISAGFLGASSTNDFNGGTGDDTFNVTGSLSGGATLNINGGAPTTFPGDVLNVPNGDVVTTDGSGSGTVGTAMATPKNVVTSYTGIETVNATSGTYDLIVNAPAATPNAISMVLINGGTTLDVFVDGNESQYSYASLASITVNGGNLADTLTVDNSGGLIAPAGGITFNGGLGFDSLIVTGNAGAGVTAVYNDTGSTATGFSGNVNSTQGATVEAISFTGLSPVEYLTGVSSLTINMAAGANTENIVAGPLSSGIDPYTLTNSPTYEVTYNVGEPIDWRNASTVTVNGSAGSDTITEDLPTQEDAGSPNQLTTLDVNGNGGGDTFDAEATPSGVTSNWVGASLDTVRVTNAGSVQGINGVLNLENPFRFNFVTVDDSADTTGRTATLSTLGTNPADSESSTDVYGQIVGLAPAHINYEYLDTRVLTIDGGSGGNNFYVQATGAGFTTTVNTGSGNDTVDVSSDAPTDTGNLANINGPLDLNTQAGTDTLNVSDLGGTAATTYALTGGPASLAPSVLTASTMPGTITFGGPNFGVGTLENFTLTGSTAGGNIYNIGVTPATVNNVITDGNAAGTGGSTFNIQANNLQGGATNTFNGNENGNTFNANYAADTSTSAAAGTTFVINAGTTGTSAARNVVNLDTTADTVARNLGFTYPSAIGGDVNVTGLGAPTHLTVTAAQEVNYFGSANPNTAAVIGVGTGSVLSVTPTAANSADVLLNGSPEILTPTSSANNPGVFGGGGAPDLYFNGLDQGTGLTVNGGGGTAQLVVNATTEDSGGLAGTSGWAGLQMSVGTYAGGGTFTPSTIRTAGNAYDTIAVSDAAVSISNNAVGNLVQTNIAAGTFGNPSPTNPGLTVNSGDEVGVQPNGIADDITVTLSPTLAILVNGGNPTAASPGPNPITHVPQGDQLNVLTPAEADIFSDNANPPHVSIDSLTQGTLPVSYTSIERLNVTPGNGIVNLIGDDNVPGKNQNDYFKVRGGPDLLSPIVPANGVVQFSLQIGGDWNPATGAKDVNATPIYFSGVTRINAGGGAATGFDASGNATFDSADPAGVNALDITPYADITPQGWGIATYWNQGNKVADGGYPDLLVYNGVAGVSDNIVVQPSESSAGLTGPAGQIIDTEAGTNTPVAIVNYTFNTNIVVNGFSTGGVAGDTDTLTLMGTDPGSAGASGNEDFLANFSAAAGTPAAPNVRVYDAGAGALSGRPATAAETADTAGTSGTLTHLYNLQSFSNFSTINFATGDGNDLVDLIAGLANGSLGVNVNTGATGQNTTVEADGAAGGPNSFTVTPGASHNTGSVSVQAGAATAATPLNFGHTQNIAIVGGLAASADAITLNGTSGSDTFTATPGGVGLGNTGTAQVSAGPNVSFTSLGTGASLTLAGNGGSDTFNLTQAAAANGPIPSVTVNGAAASSAAVLGTAANDTFAYTANSANSATLVVNGATGTSYTLNGLTSLSADGAAGTNTLNVTNANAVITPGAATGTGTVTASNTAG
ncbi:MAG: hypothetical protein B7Z73_00915, partial [Planctomycetia bacterium 21-64-5]